MKAKQRAAVAEIIMALTNDGRIKNVYSYELATYISLSGTAEKSHVNAYDYSRSCHITGTAIMVNNIACTTTGLLAISA